MNSDTRSVRSSSWHLTGLEWTWFAFVAAALLLLVIDDLPLWTVAVVLAAGALALAARPTRSVKLDVDRRDLMAMGLLYVVVVAAFRIAFTVFTTDNVLGLFLGFGSGLLLGVAGPIFYEVWMRGRDLRSLGLGLYRLRETVLVGVVLALIQFVVVFRGFQLPDPVDWVPLLVMSIVVGFFEAVFFRGFIQNRLEASFGTLPAVAGAALLYSLYHVGYGMAFEEMWFLLGLGVVYAIAFRLTRNILVLWPLLTPVGAFFNNVTAGDIELPWASIAGFADVGVLMGLAVWLAQRRIRKRSEASEPDRDRVLIDI
jgi:uncharacterized protein